MPIIYHFLCSCYISPVSFLLSRRIPRALTLARIARPCTMERRVIGLTIQTVNTCDFRKVTRSGRISRESIKARVFQ